MKRFIVFCLVLLIGCTLVGCGTTIEVENESNNGITSTPNTYIEIWTDEETGVQYIIYDRAGGYAGRGGITPRLNSDGSLYGFNEVELEPCPICGEEVDLFPVNESFHIKCNNCGLDTGFYETKQDCIRQWNDRK